MSWIQSFEKNKNGSYREDGYTLMELLVVLAILGMLAAIATPYALRYLDDAKVRTTKLEISNISASLDLMRYDVGRYPTTQEGLNALIKAPPTMDNWSGPYIKKNSSLVDPWGHAYQYRSPGEHGDFDLYSNGAGAINASSGKMIANW